MTPVLHRPQPLPLVRLRFGAVMVVVVLHLALLWMANLNWPVSTVMPGAAHNTRQGIGGQIFTKTGNSLSAGSHPGYQVITSAGHQRFGRAESMLLLADARVNRNPPPVKGAGVTTLS